MKWMIVVLLGVFSITAYCGEAPAAYPDKQVKIIIGYEPASATDISARTLLPLVEKELGQPIMIINKPGAASALALREVYAAKPDGYTVGVSCSVNVLKIQGLLPYTHHDFDVIAVPYMTWGCIGVPAKSPFQSMKELVDYAKANPGKLRMSTTAKGANYWVQVKFFEKVTGSTYKIITNPGGGSYIATQLGGNHADVGFASYKVFRSQIDAGNIRVLGISMAKRVVGFENLPTLKEQGYDMVIESWGAYVAPKGLSPEVKKKLISVFTKASDSKEWRGWCIKEATEATPEYVGDAAVKYLDKNGEMLAPILKDIKD
jgi:tripartite-type tricarboxylate transporter receptor subunit TctC